jgi:glycosyltransferase involved in cell wall biosynthesis
MPPTVSVNLCCYNSARFLEETLRSVFAQTFTDWELVIVDDGSTDSTESIVRRHIEHGRKILYHRQPNSGLGASRNKALSLSRGTYIALIDHDDVWAPRKLELQVRQMAANERLALSYTDTQVIDGLGRVVRDYMPRELTAQGDVLAPLFLRDFIACSSVLIRRDAMDEASAFRPELRITEEYELFLRLAEWHPFGHVEEPLLQLRMHGGNASWNFLRTRAENRIVLGEALQRNPSLRQQVGNTAVRVRLAGFSCTPGEALFLREPLRTLRQGTRQTLRDSIRAAAKAVLSALPDSIAGWVLRDTSARRRRATLVTPE